MINSVWDHQSQHGVCKCLVTFTLAAKCLVLLGLLIREQIMISWKLISAAARCQLCPRLDITLYLSFLLCLSWFFHLSFSTLSLCVPEKNGRDLVHFACQYYIICIFRIFKIFERKSYTNKGSKERYIILWHNLDLYIVLLYISLQFQCKKIICLQHRCTDCCSQEMFSLTLI